MTLKQKIDGKRIFLTNSVKYLGIHLDPHLLSFCIYIYIYIGQNIFYLLTNQLFAIWLPSHINDRKLEIYFFLRKRKQCAAFLCIVAVVKQDEKICGKINQISSHT